MLPDVAGEQRGLARSLRGIGVGGAEDFERSVRAAHKPGPSRAEPAFSGLGEFLLELAEGAEGRGDRAGELAGGLAPTRRRKAVPVEVVVPDLGGVVEYGAVRALDDLLERRALERAALDELVQLGDVSAVMLAVVELERFARQVRLERVHRIGQGTKFMLHASLRRLNAGQTQVKSGYIDRTAELRCAP